MEAHEAYEEGLKHDPNSTQLKEASKNIEAKMSKSALYNTGDIPIIKKKSKSLRK